MPRSTCGRRRCWRTISACPAGSSVTSSSDERLIDLVQAVGGGAYLSGAGGQNYQHPEKFAAAGIDLQVREYKPRPYARAQGDFVPGLSILDALFNIGPATVEHLSYEGAPQETVEASCPTA